MLRCFLRSLWLMKLEILFRLVHPSPDCEFYIIMDNLATLEYNFPLFSQSVLPRIGLMNRWIDDMK